MVEGLCCGWRAVVFEDEREEGRIDDGGWEWGRELVDQLVPSGVWEGVGLLVN